MTQLWNPREVLEVQNHGSSCVGKGKKKKHCANSVSKYREEAIAILDSIAVQPPTSPFVLSHLRRLAYVSLCKRWHRDKPGHAQVDRMEIIWTEAIRRYTTEAAKITMAEERMRSFTRSAAVRSSTLAPVQTFHSEIEPDFEESPLPSPTVAPVALEEEESDFEDSGIDLSSDVLDSKGASDEFPEKDQEDSEREEEASMANHPYLALNFASVHPTPLQPWLHANVSSVVDIDVETATHTETSELVSFPSTKPATPTVAAVESLDANLDASSSSSEQNRLSVALNHLSDTWQSFRMTAKDYSARYNLFDFRSVSWKDVQLFVGDGTNLGVAGFVGMGCVLWWTLRGRPRVETVASMLWTRRH